MNGSQVTVVVITIGSREQKGLVAFRRRLAGLTNKMTSGGPTSLKKALTWYYGEDGPVYFKNASAGYYKGMDDIRSALQSQVRSNQERILMDQLARRMLADASVTVFDDSLNESWSRRNKSP